MPTVNGKCLSDGSVLDLRTYQAAKNFVQILVFSRNCVDLSGLRYRVTENGNAEVALIALNSDAWLASYKGNFKP